MLLFSLFLTLLFTASASSLWTMWLGMEMFNFFFTPWLMQEENYKKSSKVFFFFVIQIMASGMFLLGMSNSYNFFFYCILFFSVLVKLGGFPFFQWVLMVVEGMKWLKFSFFMTISKMGPMITMTFVNPIIFVAKLIWGGVLTPLLGLKTSSIRMMLCYSSIAYMSWIITTMCVSKSLLSFFIFSYWLVFIVSCFIFKKMLINSLKDFFRSQFSLLEISLILSLMGFPPFLGFFPKLFTVKFLCENAFFIEAMLLSILSVVPFYFYLKMLVSSNIKFSFMNNSFIPLFLISKEKLIWMKIFVLLFSLEIMFYSCM